MLFHLLITRRPVTRPPPLSPLFSPIYMRPHRNSLKKSRQPITRKLVTRARALTYAKSATTALTTAAHAIDDDRHRSIKVSSKFLRALTHHPNQTQTPVGLPSIFSRPLSSCNVTARRINLMFTSLATPVVGKV